MKWDEILDAKNRYDEKGFLDEYLEWGDRLIESYKSTKSHQDNIEKAMIMGMGGSGIVGDIIKKYIESTNNIWIDVIKTDKLPHDTSKYDIIIFISFSGNTKETIEAFRKTLKNNGNREKVYGITTGGILEKEANKFNTNIIKVKPALAPRSGLPQLLGATLKLFEPTTKDNLQNTIIKIGKLLKGDARKNYIENKENRAYKIAYHIWGRYPIFYGTDITEPILKRVKAMINENAKLSGYYQIFPEGYHNEVEIFDYQIDPVLLPLIIRWEREEDEFIYLKNYLEEKDIEYYEIVIEANEYLEYLLRGILILDMATIYLAYLTRRKPLETNVINWIKERRRLE